MLFGMILFQSGCGRSKPPVTAERAPSPESVQAKQQQLVKLPPPEMPQVQAAVRRVFKDSAAIDESHNPAFVAGDFNGDLSQDLAVIVKPSPGKVADLNELYPAWMLRDVFQPPDPNKVSLRVEDNDVMLAIIHGFGDTGWRDEQATQTYLLKNAVGPSMSVHEGKSFVAANSKKSLPGIQGDLIGEVLRGASGYLYFSGPTYSWYDPKTFKGGTRVATVHGR
jgi:hypothetical protein